MPKLAAGACFAVLGLVLLGGLFLLYKGLVNIQRSLVSVNWPKTAGMVTSSETTRTATADSRTTDYSVSFSTDTRIHYQVDGRDYSTNVLYFGQTLGSSDASEASLQRLRFPEGKAVNVSYNPSSPAIGVVRPGLHSDAFWLPGASLALILPALLCLYIVPKAIKQSVVSEKALEEAFEQAIEEGRRGIHPATAGMPIPPEAAGSGGMALAAAFMGSVACGLGLLALTAGAEHYWRGNASLAWPTTSGVVVAASKGATSDEDNGGLESGSDTTPNAHFVYRYNVSGADHFNNQRRFAGVEGGSDAEQSRLGDRYRRGATVKVSYFPSDPDIAVLEPGNTSDSLILPAIGAALLLFGAAIFVFIVPAVLRN